MKNPLIKRLPRELKKEAGKYIVIFLFMVITIGFVSGFVVATHSLAYEFDNSFDVRNIEDGHFALEEKMTGDLPDRIESMDVAVHELFYKDIEQGKYTYRVYKNRDKVNLTCLMDGKIAEKSDEITIDRLFAKNHSINIGDSIDLEGHSFKVTGTVALSDYTSLFEENTSLMFNVQTFTVALVTPEGFDKLSDNHISFCYAWIFNDNSLDEIQKYDRSNDLRDEIIKYAAMTDFVTEPNNRAIHFAGDDIGSDESMMITFLYIIIVILAFIFAVTTSNTIEKESKVIGTLRASGYTKGELTAHYIVIPVFVTLIGALLGNILGYTYFKDLVANVYYKSYSLPRYKTLWSSFAFVNTTVVPILLMLIVNLFIIRRKLELSPLKFLRGDLKKKKNQKAVRLPDFKFFSRFRIRILIQNLPTYLVMFLGILFANFLLLFGLMMTPWLDHYHDIIIDKSFADYQYILKMPVETELEQAEKFATLTLETDFDNVEEQTEITVYGIEDNSLYLSTLDFGKDGETIYVTDGIMKKFGIDFGDTLTLKKKFGNDTYDLKVSQSYDYPATMAVFMNIDTFRDKFDKDDGYFTGYLSDREIADIDEEWIAATITPSDLTVLTEQLTDSMGSLFPIWSGFSVFLSILIIYLLSKIIIDKNARSVSLVKVLGFKDSEISSLYLAATGFVVILSILLSLPICYYLLDSIFVIMMSSYNAWIELYIAPVIWAKIVVCGSVSYFLVSLLQFLHIRRIPFLKRDDG